MNSPLSDEHKTVLRSNGWLATRNPDFQDAFLGLGFLQTLEPEAPVYTLGRKVTHVFGLISGQIDVHLTAPNGEELVYPFPIPGRWYGLIDVLSDEPAYASALTHTSSLVHCIPMAELLAFLNAQPDRYRDIINHEFVLRRQMQETVLDLVTQDGLDLVARRLLRMMEADSTGQSATLNISQVQLAHAIGLSPPTVQRAFRELKSLEMIETLYGSVRILNRDRLVAFVEEHSA